MILLSHIPRVLQLAARVERDHRSPATTFSTYKLLSVKGDFR